MKIASCVSGNTYGEVHADAHERAHQRADRHPHGTDPLHQINTKDYVDARFANSRNRSQVLLPGGHHHEDIGQRELSHHVACDQHFQVKRALRCIAFPHPQAEQGISAQIRGKPIMHSSNAQ